MCEQRKEREWCGLEKLYKKKKDGVVGLGRATHAFYSSLIALLSRNFGLGNLLAQTPSLQRFSETF